MNLFGRILQLSRGKLNKNTQRVRGWEDATYNLTSSFAINVQNKIASEISKVSFNHVKYKKNEKGADTLISMAGSDIDEVLNWSPKGQKNSMEFWSKVVKKMMTQKHITLMPHFDPNGVLLDLTFLDETDKIIDYDETVNLISPFFTNQDTSLLDNALSSIASKMDQGKIRALYKVNAQLDFDFVDEFKEKAMATIESMQSGSTFNGIAPIDSKGEIIELKKDYSVLNKEEIELIKSELLSAFFMSESILLGTASQEEQMYFYNSTIIPLLVQLEKELTYKLLGANTRRVTAQNLYYQRIIIDNQLFKFATLKELIDLYHENTQAPLFTVNEMKIKMGEQPIEGGDIYFTNKNAVAINNLADLINTDKNSSEKGQNETN